MLRLQKLPSWVQEGNEFWLCARRKGSLKHLKSSEARSKNIFVFAQNLILLLPGRKLAYGLVGFHNVMPFPKLGVVFGEISGFQAFVFLKVFKLGLSYQFIPIDHQFPLVGVCYLKVNVQSQFILLAAALHVFVFFNNVQRSVHPKPTPKIKVHKDQFVSIIGQFVKAHGALVQRFPVVNAQ